MEHAGRKLFSRSNKRKWMSPWFYAAGGALKRLVWDLTCSHSAPDGFLDLPNPLIF